MQFNQRCDRDARGADAHASAGGCIEHPRRHNNDLAGPHLHVHHIAPGAPFPVLAAQPPPVKGVPSVMNFDLLPDMGRMTR